MMKTLKTSLCVIALLAFTGQTYAQILPGKIYTGDKLPTQQGWEELRMDASVNTSAAPTTTQANLDRSGNKVLKLQSDNTGEKYSQLQWYKTGLNFERSEGYAIEIKAKVINADKTGAFNIQGFDNEGKGFRIGILNDKITTLTDPLKATNVVASGLNNSGDFHIFRFVFEPAPSTQATVYRDGVAIGTFNVAQFEYDNLIENGGFEDPDFPDFKSRGNLTRVAGGWDGTSYALQMDNLGKVPEDGWSATEAARTRPIPIRPNTQYDIVVTRNRTYTSSDWCFRDMGTFYDYDQGTVTYSDMRRNAEMGRDRGTHLWAGCNENFWQIHGQTITTPNNVKTVRFEFPVWRQGTSGKKVQTSIDNIIFREKRAVGPGSSFSTAHGFPEPLFPEGMVNLIKNGDFEDLDTNNDGTPYRWAKSASARHTMESNLPAAYNPVWGGLVRLQTFNKVDDNVQGDYKRSGNNCLRWTTLGSDSEGLGFGNGWGNRLDFKVVLEKNKTYRFNFWYALPKWGERGWLKIRINDNCASKTGGKVVWGQQLNPGAGQHAAGWMNADVVFTTDNSNYVMHFYDASRESWWWNLYFDDFVLYEVSSTQAIDPVVDNYIKAGKENLIKNGDFENINTNNDGSSYTWTLATDPNPTSSNNYPVANNPVWGTAVRLQNKEQANATDLEWGGNLISAWEGADGFDTGKQWAHSGNNSLRVSFLDGPPAGQPGRCNINFQKELEPNAIYTFTFWLKAASWNDGGHVAVANGNLRLWDERIWVKYMNWVRQSITFTTTELDHNLRLFTEFGGWMNLYLDDLSLFKVGDYTPDYSTSDIVNKDDKFYLAFGKSSGASNLDVEVEYILLDNTGPAMPDYVVDDNTKSWTGYQTHRSNTKQANIVFRTDGEFTTASPNAVDGVVKIEKTFYAGQWYAIGFPFDIAEVRCNQVGRETIRLRTYNPNGASGEKGDFWLRTYDGVSNLFEEYDHYSMTIAAGGYVLAVPQSLSGSTFTFISYPGAVLSNSTDYSGLSNGYTLVANPSVKNDATLNFADANYKYYLFEINNRAGNFGLLTSTNNFKYDAIRPFESLVVAKNIVGPLRTTLDLDNLTSIQKQDLAGEKLLSTEYYNLQGQRILKPQSKSIYIVKLIYESGKTEVVKQIEK